jgi:hypothetical protein
VLSFRPVRTRLSSPLATWFADRAAVARFQRRRRGRAPVVLRPRDRAWRAIAPGFRAWVALTAAGLPFQIVANRRYDRSGDPAQVPRALAAGATIYFPQVHQVLPRLMRLMVALRATVLGPGREECSFLFVVQGRGLPGMGLHHDGDVEALWLQLEGRRTVTLGPRVARGTPADLDEHRRAPRGSRRWPTIDLDQGTLFYLPPYTPHRVVCHGRSLAVSLTWGRRRAPRAGRRASRRQARARAARLTRWDVVSGRVDRIPAASRSRVFTQVPAVAGPLDPHRHEFPLWTPAGGELWLPAAVRPLARQLLAMPSGPRGRRGPGHPAVDLLLAHGILGQRELPLRILPDDPAALDGWSFA